MAYDDVFEDVMEAYDDDYTEAWDDAWDDSFDGEEYGENSRRNTRKPFRRPPLANGRNFLKRGSSPSAPIRGTVNTPVGQAKVNLPGNLVRQEELERRLRGVSEDLRKNSAAISKINENLNELNKKSADVSAVLAKRTGGVDKRLTALQTQQMFSLFLQPKLQSLKIKPVTPDGGSGNGSGSSIPTSFEIEEAKYDNTLPLMSMMMSGSFNTGNNGSGQNNMMMMPMMLMLMDGNKLGGSGKDDKTMLMMVMMMMMGGMNNSGNGDKK